MSSGAGMTVVVADCIEHMRSMDEHSVDAVVCDPPYGLEFMGKDWDKLGATNEEAADSPGWRAGHGGAGAASATNGVPFGGAGQRVRYGTSSASMQTWHEQWATECLRVLKPGGHLLAFGGTRTYHRLAAGIEDAGFEIRDCLAWMYGSGFPKSHNLDGEWDGWGTALKPAFEPVVVARKPLVGTVAANVLLHGTGALNIDGCRVANTAEDRVANTAEDRAASEAAMSGERMWRRAGQEGAATFGTGLQEGPQAMPEQGRWPANVVLDEEAAGLLDEQTGELTSGANPSRRGSDKLRDAYGDFKGQEECSPARGADSGGASRFFYCAKASSAERNAGLDGFEERARGNLNQGMQNMGKRTTHFRNAHPTVKPVELMRWLIRLVTPPGGLVLDPFTGSGTTGVAAHLEGVEFLGIEREAEYAEIARARIEWWRANSDAGAPTDAVLKVERDPAQLDLLGGEAA